MIRAARHSAYRADYSKKRRKGSHRNYNAVTAFFSVLSERDIPTHDLHSDEIGREDRYVAFLGFQKDVYFIAFAAFVPVYFLIYPLCANR